MNSKEKHEIKNGLQGLRLAILNLRDNISRSNFDDEITEMIFCSLEKDITILDNYITEELLQERK